MCAAFTKSMVFDRLSLGTARADIMQNATGSLTSRRWPSATQRMIGLVCYPIPNGWPLLTLDPEDLVRTLERRQQPGVNGVDGRAENR